jgi:hypothetical protein
MQVNPILVSHQDFHGGGLDGDVNGVEVGLLYVSHPLDVHVQDTDEVLSPHILNRRLTA